MMIVAYSDDKKLFLELLAKGRELAKGLNVPLAGLIIGATSPDFEKTLISHGADKVIVTGEGQEQFKVEEYCEILKGIIADIKPGIVLIGNTKNGKELATRTAGQLETGCITDCTALYLDDDKNLTAERIVYGGNATAIQKMSSEIKIVTVPPRTSEVLPEDNSRKAEVQKMEITPVKSPSKIVTVREKQVEGMNIEDATVIVSCGRGLKKKEDLSMAKELADILKGEAIGCSRPLSADLNWLSEDHWVGLSGHKVKPRVYIAVGISGQIQHLAGMRESDVIVAINKDPEAPIFKATDYGIVGDLYQVLPLFIKSIKEKMG